MTIIFNLECDKCRNGDPYNDICSNVHRMFGKNGDSNFIKGECFVCEKLICMAHVNDHLSPGCGHILCSDLKCWINKKRCRHCDKWTCERCLFFGKCTKCNKI